ncbi:MAG: hypothetical protein F4152_07980, partial [Dehalococcoidia bacterium]|nr:hypothetical protein [Dehalococcoidia bacterium]
MPMRTKGCRSQHEPGRQAAGGPRRAAMAGREVQGVPGMELFRRWRALWLATLVCVIAFGVLAPASERLHAQDPPPNNPATGTLTITGTPRVGEVLWVDFSAIADADGIENAEFQLQINFDDDISTPEDSFLRAVGFVTHYEVRPDDAGLHVGFRLSFDDDADNYENFEYVWTSVVVAVVPAPPEDLTASLTNTGDLNLSWTAPSWDLTTSDADGVGDGGSDITGYKVQWKLASGSWTNAADVTEETVTGTTYAITGLNANSTYNMRVLAVNAVGDGAPSTEVTVSGSNVNVGPVVSGDGLPQLAETNRPPRVTTYTASDPESDSISWSLSGPDRNAFTITGGELTFKVPKNFENPEDANGNNTYEIVVMASDGSNVVGRKVTVIMWDIDEAPVITGPSTVRYDPLGTTPVAVYRATDPEGATVSWGALGGSDAAAFEFNNGALRFLQPPDLENPADADRDNVYDVTVKASAPNPGSVATGSRPTGTLDVTITVAARPVLPPVIIGGGGGGGGPSGPTPSEADFEWAVEHDIEELVEVNDWPSGVWSDGKTLWILDNPNG